MRNFKTHSMKQVKHHLNLKKNVVSDLHKVNNFFMLIILLFSLMDYKKLKNKTLPH